MGRMLRLQMQKWPELMFVFLGSKVVLGRRGLKFGIKLLCLDTFGVFLLGLALFRWLGLRKNF
jgi:hypothetical protein